MITCIECSTTLAPPFSRCEVCDDPDACTFCPLCSRCQREDHAVDPMHFACACSATPMQAVLRTWAADLSEHVGA
jgi:hypothetical protein